MPTKPTITQWIVIIILSLTMSALLTGMIPLPAAHIAPAPEPREG